MNPLVGGRPCGSWPGHSIQVRLSFGHNDTRDFIGCAGSANREAVVTASSKSADEVEVDAG